MMFLPTSLGALKPSANAVISLIAATLGAVANSTSVSHSTPAGIANGDSLYAMVLGTGTLTPPAGWTLVVTASTPAGSSIREAYIYRKDTVTSADSSTSFTWSHSPTGRIGVSYVVARSSSGGITEAQTDTLPSTYVKTSGSTADAACPILTATFDGELFLLMAVSELALGGTNLWVAPAGSTLQTSPALGTASPEWRFAVATQSRNLGQSNSSPFTINFSTNSTYYFTSVALRLRPT